MCTKSWVLNHAVHFILQNHCSKCICLSTYSRFRTLKTPNDAETDSQCVALHRYTRAVWELTVLLRPWLWWIMPGLMSGSGKGESGSLHQLSVGFSCFSMRALGWSGLMLWKCSTVDSGAVCYGRGTNSPGSGQRKEVVSTVSASWSGRVADALRLKSVYSVSLGWGCFVIVFFVFFSCKWEQHRKTLFALFSRTYCG